MDSQTELGVTISQPEKPSLIRRIINLFPSRSKTRGMNLLDELARRSQEPQHQVAERKKDGIEQFKGEILQEIEDRSRIIQKTGICPILTHFTATDNLLSMLAKTNDAEFGSDALRIRIHEINEQLGITSKKGWGSDRGRVSFYVAGLDRQILRKDDGLAIEPISYEVNSAARMDEHGETAIYVLPWFAVMGDDFTSFDQADAGELQLDLDPSGSRDALIKRGVSLVNPLVQILVPKVHEEKFRDAIAAINNPELKQQLLRQIYFVTPDEANEISVKIRNNAFTGTLVENIAERNEVSTYSIYDQAAVYSIINPRKFTRRFLGFNYAFEIREYIKEYGLKDALQYTIRTSRDMLLPLLLKQVARQSKLENNPFPSSAHIVEALFEKVKSYT